MLSYMIGENLRRSMNVVFETDFVIGDPHILNELLNYACTDHIASRQAAAGYCNLYVQNEI